MYVQDEIAASYAVHWICATTELAMLHWSCVYHYESIGHLVSPHGTTIRFSGGTQVFQVLGKP